MTGGELTKMHVSLPTGEREIPVSACLWLLASPPPVLALH